MHVPGSPPVFVDGYACDASGRITIFELFGCFFHGHAACFPANRLNPVCQQTFGVLYASTLDRIARLSRAYKLVYVWECQVKKELRGGESPMRTFFDQYRVTRAKEREREKAKSCPGYAPPTASGNPGRSNRGPRRVRRIYRGDEARVSGREQVRLS